MKYIKKYERYKKPVYYSFHDDMNEDHPDVDYFLNIIKTKEIYEGSLENLFYWSCRNFPKLAIELNGVIPFKIILKGIIGIVQLNYDNFRAILKKNNLYTLLINNKEFIEKILYYGDDTKKLILLKKLGFVFNQSLLRTACFVGCVNIVKYLVNQGFDPKEKKEDSFTYAPENCLDIATQWNKTPEVIKYLVEQLKIPVTYRHIINVIYKDNLNAIPILINAKIIVDDYCYSRYATHQENKEPYRLGDVVKIMLNKNLDDLLKIILIKEKDHGYDQLQKLPELGFSNLYLNPKYLEFAYWIINNWNGENENFISTKFITTNNEKFWFRKIRKNPSIIPKLTKMRQEVLDSYKYQKLILNKDEKNIKYIINNLHPRILSEFDHIPEILNKIANKYNI